MQPWYTRAFCRKKLKPSVAMRKLGIEYRLDAEKREGGTLIKVVEEQEEIGENEEDGGSQTSPQRPK